MILAILALYRIAPDYYILQIDLLQVEDWVSMCARMWDSEADPSVKISAAMSFQHITDIFFRMSPDDHFYLLVQAWLKGTL
jgi:hypothetical protein